MLLTFLHFLQIILSGQAQDPSLILPKPSNPDNLSIPLTHTISLTLSAQDICIEPILQHFLENLQKLITTLQSQTNCLMGRKRTLPNYFFGQNKRRTIEVENNNVTYVEDSDGQFYQGTDVNSTLLQHSGQDDMHGLPTRVPRLIVRKSLIHVKREARALASRQFLSNDDISYSLISSNVADMAGVAGQCTAPTLSMILIFCNCRDIGQAPTVCILRE